MRWALGLTSALALAACRGDAPVLRADIPVEATDHALIVALLRPEQAPELRAYAIVDGIIDPAWMVALEPDTSLRLQVLLYQDTLETLELEPGPLPPSVPGAPSRLLPRPDRVAERRLTAATLEDWTEEALDPALGVFQLAVECTQFQLEEVPLPGGVPALFLVASKGRLILGNQDGEIFWARPDHSFVSLNTGDLYWDAYPDTDGTLHLAGNAGAIVRGILSDAEPPVLTLTPESTVPDGGDVLFLDGNPALNTTERFAITDVGYYEDHGSGWVRGFARGRGRGLAYIGNGQARAVYAYEFFLRGLENGAPVTDNVHDSSIVGGMTAIGYVPGYGAVAGAEFGLVFRRAGQGQWENIANLDAPALLQVRGIAAYRGGFLYARSDGLLQVLNSQACQDFLPVSSPGDQARPEIGVEVGDAIARGGRAELTVVGPQVAALGWRGPEAARVPSLLWFKAP